MTHTDLPERRNRKRTIRQGNQRYRDPSRDLDPGMSKAEEQRLVQQFIADATIEALSEAVLHRLARCDVMPLLAHLPGPCQDRIAG